MTYYLAKLILTALAVVLVSEVAKRSTLLGSLLASLPLVSLLAMIWLYAETRDAGKIAALSSGIFWLVLPSLSLFLTLPLFLKRDLGFYASLALSTGIMLTCYAVMLVALKRAGLKL